MYVRVCVCGLRDLAWPVVRNHVGPKILREVRNFLLFRGPVASIFGFRWSAFAWGNAQRRQTEVGEARTKQAKGERNEVANRGEISLRLMKANIQRGVS